MKVKSESEVAQSCPTLSDPMGLWTAFMVGTVPYIPADLGKIVFSMLVGGNIRKRIRNNR